MKGQNAIEQIFSHHNYYMGTSPSLPMGDLFKRVCCKAIYSIMLWNDIEILCLKPLLYWPQLTQTRDSLRMNVEWNMLTDIGMPQLTVETETWACFNIKTIFPGTEITMLKKRQSTDRFIFNKGIPGKITFYIDTAPGAKQTWRSAVQYTRLDHGKDPLKFGKSIDIHEGGT